jgi:hypothetical protein
MQIDLAKKKLRLTGDLGGNCMQPTTPTVVRGCIGNETVDGVKKL